MFHVYKEYQKGIYALDDIELHVNRGEFVFLTGHSGAGKTTLLRLLFCAEKPNSGQILVNRRNIHRISRSTIPFFRREIGVIFQDFKLISYRNVYANIALAMEVAGKKQKDIDNRVHELAEYLTLSGRLEDYPSYLSGGEQQRVAIARALANQPSLLLADEPTGNLDPDLSWDIMKLLQESNDKGATILVATHNDELVEKMGKPEIHLESGKVTLDQRGDGFLN